jgi:hypothetical protein
MTRFEYINRNIDRIKYEVKIGLISSTVIKYWAIYCRFDYYRRIGEGVNRAVTFAAKDFKMEDIGGVYRIKKKMESEL